MGPTPLADTLLRREKFGHRHREGNAMGTQRIHRKTHRTEHRVMMEAEIGGKRLQATEHEGLPATTRSEDKARKDPPLESSERAWPCRHLDIRLLVSQTVRE